MRKYLSAIVIGAIIVFIVISSLISRRAKIATYTVIPQAETASKNSNKNQVDLTKCLDPYGNELPPHSCDKG